MGICYKEKAKKECTPCWCWTCWIFWILVVTGLVIGFFVLKNKMSKSGEITDDDGSEIHRRMLRGYWSNTM